MIVGKGGMVGFLGTNNAYDAEMKALAGDTDAKKVFEAFVYQVAKYIGAMATVLKCEVDAILLTGGMAKSTRLTDQIADRVQRLAPVTVYPGEDEMRALAINGLMALKGEMEILEYKQTDLLVFFCQNRTLKLISQKSDFIFLRITMREDYKEYLPQRDPIIRETVQEQDDLHDDALDSSEEEEPLEK